MKAISHFIVFRRRSDSTQCKTKQTGIRMSHNLQLNLDVI